MVLGGARVHALAALCAVLLLSNYWAWSLYLQTREELVQQQREGPSSPALNPHRQAQRAASASLALHARALPSSPANASAGKRFRPRTPGDVLIWESFDSQLLFSDDRLYKVMKQFGNHQQEMLHIVQEGRQRLPGTPQRRAAYTFVWGSVVADRTASLTYILDFRLGSGLNASYERVHLVRHLAPAVDDASIANLASLASAQQQRTLHVLLTLQGRLDKFSLFVELLARLQQHLAPSMHLSLKLVVAVFSSSGKSATEAVEEVSNTIRAHSDGLPFLVSAVEGEFSRGRGLQAAINAVADAHALLYLCDVDMRFTADFLRRCALNAVAGQRVYFPIPFSFYRNQPLTLGEEYGTWRRFGVGMACLHKSDMAEVGGFNEAIRGWGEEDVDLYRRFIRAGKWEVMRTIDAGLTHLWHGKTCDKSLSKVQYQHCLWSKMEYEGTKRQLAMQLLKCNKSYADGN